MRLANPPLSPYPLSGPIAADLAEQARAMSYGFRSTTVRAITLRHREYAALMLELGQDGWEEQPPEPALRLFDIEIRYVPED